MKLLLFRGSPRSNISDVEVWNRENEKECDVLYVRYTFEYEASNGLETTFWIIKSMTIY